MVRRCRPNDCFPQPVGDFEPCLGDCRGVRVGVLVGVCVVVGVFVAVLVGVGVTVFVGVVVGVVATHKLAAHKFVQLLMMGLLL